METPFLFYLESENYLSMLVGGGEKMKGRVQTTV